MDDDWDLDEEPTSAREEKNAPKPKRPVLVNVEDIVLGNAGRKIDDRKVKQLERSIADQGLRHPIHVYKLPNGKFGLAAGQHRLRAFKNLGFQTIPAVIIKREQAKAWRASENLHRNDLNALEKSLEIVKYAEEREHLPNVKAVTKGGKQPHDKGYAKLAKATGYDRKRIAEAHAHAALPKSIKKAILGRRKLNTRATLNHLAEMKTEEEQLRFIRGHSSAQRGSKATKKIGKPTPSKVPKSKRIDSIAVAVLKRKWKATPFRSFYEKQPAHARKDFVRQMLH